MRPSSTACFTSLDPDLDHAFSGFGLCPLFFSFGVRCSSMGANDSEDDEDEDDELEELDEDEDEGGAA
jgi:hypothetical protein